MPSSPAPSPKGPSPTAPVDFSFKELKVLTDLLYEQPVGGIPAHTPLARDVAANEYLDGLAAGTADSPTAGGAAAAAAAGGGAANVFKCRSNSLRLCNNQLASLKGLDKVLLHVMDPANLTWLDASCNQLTSIEEVVTRCPNLQVLYLHGNLIHNLHDVLQLAKLPHLQKLTLHGCPIAEKHNYKLWVCAHLPQLRSLDFSTITKLERDKVQVWHRGYLKHQAEHQ